MAYVFGDGSYFDERTKGFDSNGLNSQFQIQRGMVSFGKLSTLDLNDWYQINLDGPGIYSIVISTDVTNNYSSSNQWQSNYSGIKVVITDRYGSPLNGIDSAFASLNSDGKIKLNYSDGYSRGDYFLKVINLSNSATDYVIGLQADSVPGVIVYGSKGQDTLRGTSGDDTFYGYGDADTIMHSPGNDYINGGSGLDFLVMSGKIDEYSISGNTIDFVIKDHLGHDGTDTVSQVERVIFNDYALAFDIDGAAGQAYRLYQAAFGRQPDLQGLGFWIDKLDDGMNLNKVAAAFYQSNEFHHLYGSFPSNANFVITLYQNVLHRAPDIGGFDFWSQKLSSGSMSRAEVLASFSESAENQAQIIGQIQGGIEYIEWT